MAEMTDYSGPFNPNIQASDFTKDTVIKFLLEKCRLFVLMEGYYQGVIRQNMGDETACDWACEVYKVDKFPRALMQGVRKVFNIQGDDVESYMKAMQCAESNGLQWDPSSPHLFEWDVELKSKNHSIFTVKRCPSLLYLEREAGGARLPDLCLGLQSEHQGQAFADTSPGRQGRYCLPVGVHHRRFVVAYWSSHRPERLG